MGFDGAQVLTLESRRGNEMGILIRNQGGTATVAPSMREATLEQNEAALQFGERLFAGEFDMMILLTGVGTRALQRVLATRYPPDAFANALRSMTVVARGPKPMAALREMGVQATIAVPEPNTWRELLTAIEGRPEKRVAVQEYGRPNNDLLAGLRARGCAVTQVPVYEWALPVDVEPLRDAARRLAAREFDFAFFTTSIQVEHLTEVAKQEGLAITDALSHYTVVSSIGPTCSERLIEYGYPVDFAPSHPKMGFLVKETADVAAELLTRKRDPR
jgi:uroporphyrinogen-III synthase